MRITALYAALLSALYLFLTFRIILYRRGHGIGLGDGGDPLLRRWIRGHGNFSEYVPWAVLLLALLELGGRPPRQLHQLGLMLVLGRLAHAWAFSRARASPVLRVAGMALTIGMIGIAALLCFLQALA